MGKYDMEIIKGMPEHIQEFLSQVGLPLIKTTYDAYEKGVDMKRLQEIIKIFAEDAIERDRLNKKTLKKLKE